MIECVFTLDYEIYGNGRGSLRDLVFEPTQKLRTVFDRAGVKFVNFVEAVELDQIERHSADPAIRDVRRQIRQLQQEGHEIALHLHPQWANARYQQGQWQLDYSEYNLCVLSPRRIQQIVDHALAWLRNVLADSKFTPVSFRAGNWLFQPTSPAARVLASCGLKIDSSVFKGGLQHQHGLDYRPALRNGWHWRFADDVNVPDSSGGLLELPIYTEMVPFWSMLTRKRVGLQQKSGPTNRRASANGGPARPTSRLRDFLRFRCPKKLDFCRMTLGEMTAMVERVRRADEQTPTVFKPLVAIGHTKDLVDLDSIEAFLIWLKDRGIPVSTLASVYQRCMSVG